MLSAQLSFYLTGSALPLYLRHSGAPVARIGLDVGSGSIAGLMLTLAVGPLLNRRGVRLFMVAGACLYACAGAVMLAFPVEIAITAGKLLQGMGAALVTPSVYAAVPLLAPRATGIAMGLVTTLGSAPLAIGPALGLVLYAHGGPVWLLLPTILLGAGSAIVSWLLRMPKADEVTPPAPSPGFGYDRRWTPALTANMLNGVYFGGIVAYLPLVLARTHGPNAGIFFSADAVGVVLLRFPGGMLADRTRTSTPMLLGLIVTMIGLAAFVPTTNLLWLIAAGAGTGIGAGLFASGLLTEMAGRSTAGNRGTAMSLSVATASLGVFLGGAISGLLIRPTGFSGVIVFGAVAEALGIPLVLLVRPIGRDPPVEAVQA